MKRTKWRRHQDFTYITTLDYALNLHNRPINAIALNGQFLISCGRDHSIRVWSLVLGRQIHTLTGHKDGQTLFSASFKEIKIWDLPSRQLIKTLKGHSGLINAIALSEDGLILVSRGEDAQIKVWAVV